MKRSVLQVERERLDSERDSMSNLMRWVTTRLGSEQDLSHRCGRILDRLALVEALLILLDWGYLIGRSPWAQWGFQIVDGTILLVFIVTAFLKAPRAAGLSGYLVRYKGLGMGIGAWIFLVWAMSVPAARAAALLITFRQVYGLVRRGMSVNWVQVFIERLERFPARLLAFSFLAIILVGTFLLTLPQATATRAGAPWIDALFTATSATCVTGLIVVDTPVYFSRFGACVILLLIQVGGLGIMTLSTAALIVSGRRLSSRGRKAMQDIIEETNLATLPQTILFIVKMTFWAELAGGLLLFLWFLPDYERTSEAFFSAVFHSVSAFCNAGFSVFPDSLMRYQGHMGVNLTIAGLIVLGGLGFTVIAQILNRESFWKKTGRIRSLSAHVRLVLVVTGLLLLLGTVLIFFFEFDNALLGFTLKEKLMGAFFQSVTLRTAGFNTISFESLRPITLFCMMAFMFLGGSPGSTAGGIKTTTLAVLALSVRAMFTGRQEVEVFGRTVPQQVVYRATAITVVSFVMLSSLFALLLVTQTAPFEGLLFEAVSAFGTVGLSTGVTPGLTTQGKLIVVVLMFAGRIGPLTLTLALAERAKRAPYRFPTGRIMVG